MNLQPLLDALVDLYDADSAVQTITGRSTFNLTPWGAQIYDDNLPVVTYLVVSAAEAEGISGHAVVDLRVQVWVDANKVDTQDPEALLARAEALFTGPNLTTKSVDAWVNPIGRRTDAGVADGVHSISREFLIDVAI